MNSFSLRILTGLLALGLSGALVRGALAQPADLAAGQQAYQDNCARCHGATGAGDGRDAQRMFPRPRPLAEGIFKFRTTASGTPPTDEDLFRTVSEGLPGSRMPDFTRLPEETRRQLVEYVKGLSPIFQEQKPEPLKLEGDPGPAKANIGRGKELYTQLGCNACHGALGRGDGPSAPTLVDNWNQPTQAADLTQPWNYRAGSEPKDILTRLMTGLDGTPMPSYAEAVSAEEVWDLAYYVHSLQVKPRWSRTIEAARASGELPSTAEDPAWEKAPRTDLKLSGIFYKEQQIVPAQGTAISVQALYNENEVAFRLRWHDPSKNEESPPDALELALLADRRKKWEVGSLRNWEPSAGDSSAVESARWTAAPTAETTPGSYADGEWTVVIQRPRPAAAEGSPLVGFLVWDGGNQEEGRHRASSGWVDFVIKD